MTEHQQGASWNVAEWHGKMLVDRDGENIAKLQDVNVDVENDEPQFATVKEGFIGRHLTFVRLGGITVGPDDLRVAVTKDQIKSAPNIEHHGEELSQAATDTLAPRPTRHPWLLPPRPVSTRHLDDLRAEAQYARERYQLYKAKAYGPRPTSPARMRELQRACEQAEARLGAAEAQERRARNTDDSPPGAT